MSQKDNSKDVVEILLGKNSDPILLKALRILTVQQVDKEYAVVQFLKSIHQESTEVGQVPKIIHAAFTTCDWVELLNCVGIECLKPLKKSDKDPDWQALAVSFGIVALCEHSPTLFNYIDRVLNPVVDLLIESCRVDCVRIRPFLFTAGCPVDYHKIYFGEKAAEISKSSDHLHYCRQIYKRIYAQYPERITKAPLNMYGTSVFHQMTRELSHKLVSNSSTLDLVKFVTR